MAKRKASGDINQIAASIVEQTTNRDFDRSVNTTKNPAAVALGRLGGAKGGPARARKLSPDKRRKIARKAAEARWAKKS